jgi:hypothetical protein
MTNNTFKFRIISTVLLAAFISLSAFFVPDAAAKTTITVDPKTCVIFVTVHKQFIILSRSSITEWVDLEKEEIDKLKKNIEELEKEIKGLGESLTNPGRVRQAWNAYKKGLGKTLNKIWQGLGNEDPEAGRRQELINKADEIAAMQKNLEWYEKDLSELEEVLRTEQTIRAALTGEVIENKIKSWARFMENLWNKERYIYDGCQVVFRFDFLVGDEGSKKKKDYDTIFVMLSSKWRSSVSGFDGGFDNDGFSNDPYDHDMTGIWAYDDPHQNHMVPHECGHEMGLADQYIDIKIPLFVTLFKLIYGEPVSIRKTEDHKYDVMNAPRGTGFAISVSDSGKVINNVEKILRKRNIKSPDVCRKKYGDRRVRPETVLIGGSLTGIGDTSHQHTPDHQPSSSQLPPGITPIPPIGERPADVTKRPENREPLPEGGKPIDTGGKGPDATPGPAETPGPAATPGPVDTSGGGSTGQPPPTGPGQPPGTGTGTTTQVPGHAGPPQQQPTLIGGGGTMPLGEPEPLTSDQGFTETPPPDLSAYTLESPGKISAVSTKKKEKAVGVKAGVRIKDGDTIKIEFMSDPPGMLTLKDAKLTSPEGIIYTPSQKYDKKVVLLGKPVYAPRRAAADSGAAAGALLGSAFMGQEKACPSACGGGGATSSYSGSDYAGLGAGLLSTAMSQSAQSGPVQPAGGRAYRPVEKNMPLSVAEFKCPPPKESKKPWILKADMQKEDGTVVPYTFKMDLGGPAGKKSAK